MEYSYKEIVYLRAGYLFSPQSTEVTPNIFEDYTFGFGLNFESFIGMNLVMDYAYVPVKFFDNNLCLWHPAQSESILKGGWLQSFQSGPVDRRIKTNRSDNVSVIS